LQDKKQLGSALNTIAYGQAMMAAVRDYAKVSAPREPFQDRHNITRPAVAIRVSI
jgi:hypothetical protein